MRHARWILGTRDLIGWLDLLPEMISHAEWRSRSGRPASSDRLRHCGGGTVANPLQSPLFPGILIFGLLASRRYVDAR